MKIKSYKLHFIFLHLALLILNTSCGSESEVKGAIDEANILLTKRDCAGARAALDEVGYQATNARYIGVYASTYACNASYSTITFFDSDIDKIASTNTGFFGSLTTMTTSDDMSSFNDSDFVNLKAALETIYYSANQTSSASSNREAVFGIQANTNLNVQALYMNLVNLGRWLYFYGNANSAGTKGAGSDPSSNTCLFSYDTGNPVIADALDDGESGSCTTGSATGSAYMMTGDAVEEKRRLCQGIVLFNNFIDLIVNIQFSGDDASSLNDVGDTFDTLCEDITEFGDNFCDLRDQSACEDEDITDLQIFSAWLFERNFR